MSVDRLRIKYSHSKFWLIFWLLILFPVGLVLLLNYAELTSNTRVFKVKYRGEKFWLYFWAIVFFPITILLFLFNGSFVKSARN